MPSPNTTTKEISDRLKGLEYSALSWSGYNVFGDAASIRKVKALVEVAEENNKVLRAEIIRLHEQQLQNLRGSSYVPPHFRGVG